MRSDYEYHNLAIGDLPITLSISTNPRRVKSYFLTYWNQSCPEPRRKRQSKRGRGRTWWSLGLTFQSIMNHHQRHLETSDFCVGLQMNMGRTDRDQSLSSPEPATSSRTWAYVSSECRGYVRPSSSSITCVTVIFWLIIWSLEFSIYQDPATLWNLHRFLGPLSNSRSGPIYLDPAY